ncbi:Nif3-like dinuclear metal center hexameric protein [Desulfobacula phenolica]|uniref:GTP cyclohydrolase 1 type 2 homolog n=1 Tax=Desulfobacula phenolica TaxID=90732 RepID=A0A1H2EMC4_9BACT|nr:Nif3-like dinuclear metal center hexameric protein [Desulfobacula phenolica]SDT96241.1 dinuclear metal center protein, YbgI/SA1388 family [Desulfobacula phenolica]
MVKTKDILGLLNTIAPFDIAEDWDNSGLQAGNLSWEVKKVMIGLDVSLPLMNAAEKWNSDLVLTHHPLMISPEKSIDFNKMPGKAIEIAARQKISIISAHTNLDKAPDGLNDYFASKIGINTTGAFLIDPSSSMPKDAMTGIGRIGYLESPILLKYFVHQIKEKLDLKHLRVTGDMDLPVTTVAICTGSGGSLIDEFLRSGADLYITGDIKYHEARRIEEYSKGLVDVGHFGSEHMAVELLADKLGHAIQMAGLNIQIKKFKKEKDPFIIV